MRAAMFEEVGRPLKVGTVEDPRPAPDQVVIEVAHCGICGSDLHVTQHGLVPSGTILGHEFAGTIVEIGREVGGDWRVGDAADPRMPALRAVCLRSAASTRRPVQVTDRPEQRYSGAGSVHLSRLRRHLCVT